MDRLMFALATEEHLTGIILLKRNRIGIDRFGNQRQALLEKKIKN